MGTPQEWQAALLGAVADNQLKTHTALTEAQQSELDAVRAWLAANPYPTSAPAEPPVTEPPVTPPVTPPVDPPTQPPVTPPNTAAKPTFKDTFETGNYSQWNNVQNINHNGSASSYPVTGQYPLQIVSDAAAPGGKGHAARFECRNGDYPGFPSGERTEIGSPKSGVFGGHEGETHWYEWAIKFDTSFPMSGLAGKWSTLSQWKMLSDNGSPPVSWNVQNRNGSYSLCINRQSGPGAYLGTVFAVDCPIDPGHWHVYRMKVVWSVDDKVGKVQVWRDGVRQTLATHSVYNPQGGSEWTVRTLFPGGREGVYWRNGIYRQQSSLGTWIVSFSGSNAAAAANELLNIGGYAYS